MKVRYILAALIATLVTFFGFGAGTINASAAATVYSGVLEDLRTAENFNIEDYPKNEKDYSLKVIQVAESSARELFIYVYQPTGQSKNFRATCINMTLTKTTGSAPSSGSAGSGSGGGVGSGHGGGGFGGRSADSEEADTKLYNLRFLNSYETLFKYRVIDYTVSEDNIRYYDISSIYRKFAEIDGKPENGSTVSEVAFPVGQLWKATTDESGAVTYDCKDVELIDINEQTVGARRYDSGPWSGKMAYFFAFTCNRLIDRLISADLSFSAEPIKFYYDNSHKQWNTASRGDKVEHFHTYHEDEYAESVDGGWFGKKVRWDRLVSSDEFLKSGLTFSTKEKELISQYDWVINFYECDYTSVVSEVDPFMWFLYWVTDNLNAGNDYYYDSISDVSLLRLEFEYNGDIYNLGVVSNKTSSVEIFGKDKKGLWGHFIDFCKWLESITGVSYIFWAFLFIAIPVCLLLGVLAVFLPPVKIALKFAFKGLIIAVTAPFKLIAAAVRRYQANAPRRAQRKAERLRKKDFKEQMKAQAQELRERKTQRKQSEQAQRPLG